MLASRVWGSLVAIVAGSVILSVVISEDPNAGFASDTALLTFAAAVAVGIERTLEMFWTLVSQSKLGGWWPLKHVGEAFEEVEKETNKLLGDIIEQAKSALEQAKGAAGQANDVIAEIDGGLALLKDRKGELDAKFDNAKKLAPGSSRLALVTEVKDDAIATLGAVSGVLERATGQARTGLDGANRSIELALDIVESFDDNPARRVASLILGASLGILLAGYFGLNIFAATLGEEVAVVSGIGGVLITGIVVGFGASPTHEIIKGLQRFKDRNTPRIAVADGTRGVTAVAQNVALMTDASGLATLQQQRAIRSTE